MTLTNVQWVLAVVALLALIFGPSGAAAVAVKAALNGARSDIRETKETCQRMDAKIGQHSERVARLEERHTAIENRVGRLEDAA